MPVPVVIFCFNRPLHLRKTVEALQTNTLAAASDLIIYSDGPRHEEDMQKVSEVRAYLQTISGFASVSIHESAENTGLAASVIAGVTQVLKKHEKVIVIEDDMVCTADFLEYMNEALEIYAFRNHIFSVSGYGPQLQLPDHYLQDVYLVPRASSWGWGTWRNRWEQADWQVKDFGLLKKDAHLRKKLTTGGEDLWPMLVKQQLGLISSWAVRWTWSQTKNDGYGLYPVRSKIKNIGTDGSGENFSRKTSAYDNELWEGKITFEKDIRPDPQVIYLFGKKYRLSLIRKILNRIKYKT